MDIFDADDSRADVADSLEVADKRVKRRKRSESLLRQSAPDDAANDPSFGDRHIRHEGTLAENTNAAQVVSLYDLAALQTQVRQSSFSADNDLNLWFEKLNERDANLRSLNPVTAEHVKAAEKLFEEFPNMLEPLTTIIGAMHLSARSSCEFSIPPMLIQGPPGCGKTELVRRIASLLSIPLNTIPMGSINGNFELPGGHRGYRGATMGTLCKSLFNSDVANPLYLFDEAELGSAELYQPLLQFLEEDKFKDHFVEIEFNTKHVNVIFITNEKELLPPAIRSRLLEFDVGQPTDSEKIEICRRMYQRMREENPRYNIFPFDLNEKCISRLCNSSLRELRKNIEQAFFRSAVRARQDGELVISEEDIPISPRKHQSIGFI